MEDTVKALEEEVGLLEAKLGTKVKVRLVQATIHRPRRQKTRASNRRASP